MYLLVGRGLAAVARVAARLAHEKACQLRCPCGCIGAAIVLAAPVLYRCRSRSIRQLPGGSASIDKQPPPLVTSGLFAWTRNPIYTAFDLLLIGAFLIHGRVVSLLQERPSCLFVHGVVLREERFLEEQFGDAFRDYRRRVRRYGVM